MKIAIMQPYFFPYLGYFQLLNSVDEFVIYDNVQFTKKGWINRNRILVNGETAYISLPLKKASDFLDVKDRHFSETWPIDKKKMVNKITEAYKKSPYFDTVFPVVKECLDFESQNLFQFLLHTIKIINSYLNITTTLTISSTLNLDPQLKGEKRVIEMCKKSQATTYINAIGGSELYNKNEFMKQGITLKFIQMDPINYNQFDAPFTPHLSIVDVMMFNPIEKIKIMLAQYKLI